MATSSIKEITEQYEKLKNVLAIAREYGTPDRASQFGMQALLNEESNLLGQLKVAQMAEAKVAVEVAVDGDPVREYAISISFFGQLLTVIQNLTNAVAQVQANAQTARGQIKDNLISRNRFELAHTFTSSFGAALRLPIDEQEKLSFTDGTESAADVVCKLFDGQNLDTETVDFLSSSRVRGHYSTLVDLLGKQGASVVFRTQNKPKGSTITAQQARDRSLWLDLLKVESDIVPTVGELVGGSIESKKFEIKIDTGEILRGSATETAVRKMKAMNWGAFVTAQIEIAVSTHEEADLEPRTTYRLVDIERREYNQDETSFSTPQ